LIAPQFFGYETDISDELTKVGYHVDFLPDRPFNSSVMKALMRVRPELGGCQACDNFYSNQLDILARNKYSIILIIQGEGVTSSTLINFRRCFPNAKLVYYTWDSIDNKPFFKQNLSFYDVCFSFDPVDSKKYGMQFRPLFYSDRFDNPLVPNYSYDLSFIGTVHSDRYKVINSLLSQLPSEVRTFTYLYLQAPWMYDLRRIFTKTIEGAKREEFRYVPLSKDVVQDTFFKSRAVIDIEHVNQRGATMRTMESLGSKRKMVTTNTALRDYDFYNPLNIQIIDRHAPTMNKEFLASPYQEVAEEIRKKYSIRQWVKDVCDI
jgi:hypothetical protein